VDFVVAEGAGVWAPKPQQVVRALTRWLSRPGEKRAAIQAAKRAARPDAARRIAHLLVERLRTRQPSMVRTPGG
jgi:1,2-diacylglycerol 3-beta-galactosyltransferase